MELGASQVQLLVVWIDMLPADGWGAAQQAAEIFSSFPFVPQFHDPRRLAGRAVADVLGSPQKTAWDIYLLYPQDSLWEASSPSPIDWVHQMSDGAWASAGKYKPGNQLPEALKSLIKTWLGRA